MTALFQDANVPHQVDPLGGCHEVSGAGRVDASGANLRIDLEDAP